MSITVENQQTFFVFAAEVGLTKHFGGLEGTEELAGLCHIGDGSYVLDAGCGAGVTACFLVRRYDCRVVKLAESTWLKVPPPPELVAWTSQDVGACVQPLTADEWVCLLENAGLPDITVRIHPVDVKKEAVLLLQRYGYGGMIGSALRAMVMYFRNPAYRKFVKGVRKGEAVPENLAEYFGYGMYVGKKD